MKKISVVLAVLTWYRACQLSFGGSMWYMLFFLKLGFLTLKDIDLSPSDPDESDDGCLDDLIKGRQHAKWRRLL